MLHAVRPDPQQPLVFAAQPQVAVAILQHRGEVALPRHPMHQLGALALQTIQLIARNHPHRAVRCAIRPCQPRWKPERGRRAVHAPIRFAIDQSIEGADQQAPLRIDRHARKAALQRHVIVRREIVEAPIRPQATQLVPFEQQPHAAFGIHGHGMDQRLRPLPLPLPLSPLSVGTMPDQIAARIA